MAATPKTRSVRKNRFNKSTRRQRTHWTGRIARGAKLTMLILVLSATSALFVMGYAAMTRSEYFQTRAITVKGQQRLSQAEILAQAGIRQGDNLLALNLRLVRHRLLSHAWIAKARVAREIPGTITIEIQENEPLARVDLGRIFLMNTQGGLFKEVKADFAEELPLVAGLSYSDISMGADTLTSGVAAVLEVLSLSQAPRSAIGWREIERLDVDKEMGISVTLKNDRIIHLGLDQYSSKFERLGRLRPRLENNEQWREYRRVDLNNPDRVVVRLGADEEKAKG
jgi:cell division protein FtsQ